LHVIAWSRSLNEDKAKALGVGFAKDPQEVARQSDIISVHVAATPETKHLIDEKFIAAMRDGATLINTSRGSVANEQALAYGITNKNLRLGLDVFAVEPSEGQTACEIAIAQMPKVYSSHHIGASTDQAQQAIA